MEFSTVFRGTDPSPSCHLSDGDVALCSWESKSANTFSTGVGFNGAQPAPDGSLIASIVHPRLVLRSTSTLQVRRIINLNPEFASRINFVKWSPYLDGSFTSPAWHGIPLIGKRRSGIDKSESEGGGRQRILLADEQSIQVYDVEDEKWTACINQGFGGIRNVEFGRNADEVVVFSEFQVRLQSGIAFRLLFKGRVSRN